MFDKESNLLDTDASQSHGNVPAILGRHKSEIEKTIYNALSMNDQSLTNMLRYHIGWVDEHGNTVTSDQGKGFRSSLCMFTCEALGGIPEQALAPAAAIELIHNFSLVHDDIQDGDKERRHRPTVWAVWGIPMAIQVGNIMRVTADLMVQCLSIRATSVEVMTSCSRLLSAAYLEMVEGQYLDLKFEGRTDIDTAKYIDMISRKTGALIRCSMQMGASVVTDDIATMDIVTDCGRHLGSVFQIRDDYLGIWGYEAETGKTPGNDIRRKKNSLPIVYALDHASAAQKQEIQSIYRKDYIGDGDVASVLSLLHELHTQEYMQDIVSSHARHAMEAFTRLDLTDRALEKFAELVEFLVNRQK